MEAKVPITHFHPRTTFPSPPYFEPHGANSGLPIHPSTHNNQPTSTSTSTSASSIDGRSPHHGSGRLSLSLDPLSTDGRRHITDPCAPCDQRLRTMYQHGLVSSAPSTVRSCAHVGTWYSTMQQYGRGGPYSMVGCTLWHVVQHDAAVQ